METKELIFNGKKFFEGEMPNYIGKKIKLAESQYLTMYSDEDNQNADGTPADDGFGSYEGHPQRIADNQVINGQARSTKSGKIYVRVYSYWWSVDDILQNGGVSASYMTMLCSTRKEQVA